MSLTIANWPFLPEEQRTPEQNERWWAECYLPTLPDVTLQGAAYSVVVSGASGSGKSVALRALERAVAADLLGLHYPFDYWPGQPNAPAAGFHHLGQMMACAATAIKNLLTQHPHKLADLTPINLEFLRWLIEKYSGARAFRRWADALEHPALLDLLGSPFVDLYPTDTSQADAQGQLEELVTLSRRLGFNGVAVFVDIGEPETANNTLLEKVAALFGWLTPLQIEGFAIKAALPAQVVEQANLVERSRGRVTFASLRWTVENCYEVSERYLAAATAGQLSSLQKIVSTRLLASLEEQIKEVYPLPAPQPWIKLTALLLDYYTKCGRPLTEAQYGELVCAYFARYVPLRFDRQRRGVWRGLQWIALDDQPFKFFDTLWSYRNGGDPNQALMELFKNSKANLNTLASRLRKKIEPVPGQTIYIHNNRSQGYWLENVVEA